MPTAAGCVESHTFPRRARWDHELTEEIDTNRLRRLFTRRLCPGAGLQNGPVLDDLRSIQGDERDAMSRAITPVGFRGADEN